MPGDLLADVLPNLPNFNASYLLDADDLFYWVTPQIPVPDPTPAPQDGLWSAAHCRRGLAARLLHEGAPGPKSVRSEIE